MNKKIFVLAATLALTLSLAACGGKTTTPPASSAASGSAAASAGETVVLKVAASPTPHAEILKQVVDVLAEQGIELQITEYGDYVVPNTAVEEGAEDANYFQHTPYMENFNTDKGTHLVAVADLHYEPMGIFAGKCADLTAIPDGATIAVPNDPTNEARALLLLEAQGLIKLKADAGLSATPNDIVENPKNLEFKELEAAMLPNTVDEVDLSVINSNYALQGGLDPVKDALANEAPDSTPYPNVLVVKEGSEENPAVLALIKALQSDAVRDYINSTYGGAVVPLF